MHLRTWVPQAALTELLAAEILTPASQHVEPTFDPEWCGDEFRIAYAEMQTWAYNAGVAPSPSTLLLWAWARPLTDGRDVCHRLQHDINCVLHLHYDESYALVDFDLPDSQVLLTDYILWSYYALNHWYLDTAKERARINAYLEANGVDANGPQAESKFETRARRELGLSKDKNFRYEDLTPALQKEVRASWHRCILQNIPTDDTYVQATFLALPLSAVNWIRIMRKGPKRLRLSPAYKPRTLLRLGIA